MVEVEEEEEVDGDRNAGGRREDGERPLFRRFVVNCLAWYNSKTAAAAASLLAGASASAFVVKERCPPVGRVVMYLGFGLVFFFPLETWYWYCHSP